MIICSYQKNGSCIVTRDDGETLNVPAGKQTKMDAAIKAFVGPIEQEKKTDGLSKLAALLVEKGLVTEAEIAAVSVEE